MKKTAKNRDYKAFYERISAPFRGHEQALKIVNKILTVAMYVLYPLLLIILLLQRDGQFLSILLVPAVSFGLLSLVRKKIDRKRPYETWDIAPLIIKNTKGHSMPSRHLFSSAVIAMAFYWIFPWAGIVLLIVTAIEACVRVIGGVHYPSDVLVGMAVGVGCGFLIPLFF